jgi:hypothetical protein
MNEYSSKHLLQDPFNYFCPCCGFKTMYQKPPGTFNICKICFWEDDLVQFDDPNYKSGANEVSLYEARVNFKEFGASDKTYLKHVRKPTQYDTRNIEWEKLGYPLDIK